ncbi:MAG: MBL fold metallo-hydrolase [Tissierellaceae bacterium]|jgi:competence protein ComEC|nr:MBL fold metallo-hydrolase [Tissierellia bacterium]
MKIFKSTKHRYIILGIILILFLLAGCSLTIETQAGPPISEESFLKVHFIDVGQGDATLIQQINQDNTYNMLIDAGNNGDGEYLVEYLKDQGVETLDYIIGTHPHSDHIGGLDDVIKGFQVGAIIMPKVMANTRTFEEVMEAVSDKGLSITSPVPGTSYPLGEAEFTILAPNSDDYASLNDYSIANRLVFGSNSFIFTGDAEALSEEEILNNFNKRDLASDVFKLAHHGSSTSNTEDFLEAINPSYGIISCGQDNSYGHPHREIMAQLKARNILVFRTDLHGTIVINSDGKDISIETELDTGVNLGSQEVVISGLDKIAEMVTIKNNGEEDVDLGGWRLISVRGNQEFIFPKHILKAGSSVTVGGYDSRDKVDFIWELGGGVWSNSQSDPAELYDEKGNLISVFED